MSPPLFASGCFNTQRTLVDRLRSVGLDKYVELPQIAVMGDTSSGKSSVLSAISGITFPSSSELTTRCPTQLILSEAEEFSGTVRLMRFKPQEGEILESTTLSSPADITGEIERLTKQIVSEQQLISDDAIIIEVRGPGYPNLTLTDLPGLIRTVEDHEDKDIIRRVRGLVDRYLVQNRTVILAVVPANVDVHNTEILQAAQDADPEGIRTISIITKPDRIDPGAESQVVDLLMNRKKKLKLGYHAVRCRGQQDLDDGVTIADGIVNETKFFSEHKAWSDVDPSYVGINRLTEKLVKILQSIIASSLPAVIEEIESRLSTCEGKLTGLGTAVDSVTSRRLYFYGYVESVQDLIKGAVSGFYDSAFFESTDNDNRARSLIRKEETVFRETIAKTESTEQFQTNSAAPEVGELVEVSINDDWLLRKVTHVNVSSILYEGGTTWLQAPGWRHLQVLDLTFLKSEIEDNRGDELAIFPSYSLFCNLVRTYIRAWEKPMFQLLDACEGIVSAVCNRALDHSISSSSRFPKARDFASSLISEAIKSAKASATTILGDALKSEHRPYTLNHYLYDVLIKLRNGPLLKSLEGLCTPGNRSVNMDAVLTILKSHGVGNVSNEDREAIELQIAIKAYLKVSKKRFTDTVPMLIQNHFVSGVLPQIKTALSGSNDQLLETILEEPMSMVNYRAQLEAELSSLMESKKEIASLYFGA
ncbi:hypothetical protein HDU98_010311 [Podochytrium sp. JEL0797]|nr:hypothetical protein HDU98_010311 [Podochytrium sp. JEL0797]